MDLSALTRKDALLTNYPNTTKLEQTLSDLRALVTDQFLALFPEPSPAMSASEIHTAATKSQILLGVSTSPGLSLSSFFSTGLVQTLFDDYLNINFDFNPLDEFSSSDAAGSFVYLSYHIPGTSALPAFSTIPKPQFFEYIRGAVDGAERMLTDVSPTLEAAVANPASDLWMEYQSWILVVRLCIVVALIEGLPYGRMWREKDGDAGWWLSGFVAAIADFVSKHEKFVTMIQTLDDEQGYLKGLMLFDFVSTWLNDIFSLRLDPALWQVFCEQHPDACTVSDLGSVYPWAFIQIDGISHTFARTKTIERINRARQFWNSLNTRDQANAPELEEFFFNITAGSLEHGGANPPHFLLQPKPFGPNNPSYVLNRPTDATKARGSVEHMDGSTIDVNIHRRHTVNGKVVEETAIPTKDPASSIEALVNLNLAKSILLTFPRNLLFGFDFIVGGKQSDWSQATTELDTSISNLISNINNKKNPSKDDQEKRANLVLIKHLIGRVTFTEDYKGHKNHFHVGYGPDLLGDEVRGNLIIKSKTPGEALTRDRLLDPINRPLFKEILGII